jgi:Leucine-rich repeat (LRR) protein
MPRKSTGAIGSEDYADYDEGMSTGYTEGYTEDYYNEDEGAEAPTGVVNVTYASEAAQKKEQAADTRKAQQAAAARAAESATDLQTARAWLAEQGMIAEGMTDAAVTVLHAQMKSNAACLEAECKDITERWPHVTVNHAMRRVHLAGALYFFQIKIALGYPTTGDCLSVESNNSGLRHQLNHIVHSTQFVNKPGLLVRLIECCVLLTAPNGDAVSDARKSWHEVTGETLTCESESKRAEIVLSAPTQSLMQPGNAKSKWGAPTLHKTWFPAAAAPAVVRSDQLLDYLAVVAEERRDRVTIGGYIGGLPSTIAKLEWIQELCLSHCELTTLPSLGNMRPRKVYLSYNEFRLVPETLLTTERRSIRTLDMSHNALTAIPEEMTAMKNLEILQLDYNRIKGLPKAVDKWQKLEVLEIVDNMVRWLPEGVASLPNLWRLKVGANPLENLPAEIYYQGFDKVMEYLKETTVSNLPVPPRSIHRDIKLQIAAEQFGADVVLVCAAAKARAPMPSYILEARMPGLASNAVVVPLTEEAISPTNTELQEVILPDAEVSRETFDALLKLLLCELTREDVVNSATVQVQLSALVSTYGSGLLNAELSGLLRGRADVAEDILAQELEPLAMRINAAALAGEVDAARPLFRLGELVNLVVGDTKRVFVVHRRLLLARCPYFETMFRSGLTEAYERVIYLPEVDPTIFSALLLHVYTDASSKLSPDNVVALLFLAVEYQMLRLRDLAEAMVGFNVTVENAAQVIQLAYFLDSDRLKNACMYFVANNYAAVRATEGFHELQSEVKKQLFDKLFASGKVPS